MSWTASDGSSLLSCWFVFRSHNYSNGLFMLQGDRTNVSKDGYEIIRNNTTALPPRWCHVASSQIFPKYAPPSAAKYGMQKVLVKFSPET